MNQDLLREGFIAKVSLVGRALAWGLDPRCAGQRAVFVPWIQICTVILEHRDRAAVRVCQYEIHRANAHLNLQCNKTRPKPPS